MTDVPQNNINAAVVDADPREAALKEMFASGMHLGHKTSRIHPQMQRYLFGVRNGIGVIDLEQTLEKLERAESFLQKLSQDKSAIVLLVGTKVGIADVIQEYAQRLSMPWVRKRWLGGTLTNFAVISRRIKYFVDLRAKEASGELTRYTKKEQAQFAKEVADLNTKLGGLELLSELPKAVIIADVATQETAVREANRLNIPVIGIVDANADPRSIDYPIPANDESIPSVRFVLERLGRARGEGRSARERESETESKPDTKQNLNQ